MPGAASIFIQIGQIGLREHATAVTLNLMEDPTLFPHSLTRIAAPSTRLDYHTQMIAKEDPVCVRLARPLFEEGLTSAAITQRPTYDSKVHVTEYYRFTLLLRGKMSVRFDDEEHCMFPGQVILCPPGTLFRRWADKKSAESSKE